MVSVEQSNSIKNKITELKIQYKESLDKAQKIITELEQDKENAFKEKAELLKIIEKKNSDSNVEKNKLSQDLNLKNKQTEAFIEKIKELEKNSQNHQHELTKLQEKYNDSEAAIKNKEEQLNALKLELNNNILQSKQNLNRVTIIANKRKEMVEGFKKKSDDLQLELDSFNQEKSLFEQQITALAEEKQVLDNQLEQEKAHNQVLKDKTESLNKEIDFAKAENITLKTSFANLETELKALSTEKQAFDQQLTELNNEKSVLEKNLEVLNSEKKSLETTLKTVEQDFILLQMKLEELKQSEDDLKKSKEKFEEQLKVSNEKNNSFKTEIDQLKKSELDFNNQMKSLQDEINQNNKLIDELKTTRDILENKYQKQASELEHEIREVRESYELKLDIKDRKIKDLTRNIDEELKNSASLSHLNTALNEKVTSVNNEINYYKSEYEVFQEKVKRLEIENEEIDKAAQKQVAKLHVQIAELTEQLTIVETDKNKEINLIKSEKDLLENSIQDLKKELQFFSSVTEELENSKIKIKELNTEISDKDSVLKHFEQDVEHLNELLEKAKLSKKREMERFDKEINRLIEESSNLKVASSKKDIELEVSRQDVSSLKLTIENLKSNIANSEAEIAKVAKISDDLKQLLSNKDKVINDYESEVENLKARIEMLAKAKDSEIGNLYKEIDKLNRDNLKSIDAKNVPEEQKDLILELQKKNDELIVKVRDLNKLSEHSESIKNNHQDTIANLNKEIETVNSRFRLTEAELQSKSSKFQFLEKELEENKSLVYSLRQKNKELEEATQIVNQVEKTEINPEYLANLEKENSQLKNELDELKDKIKAFDIKDKDRTSIEELYQTTLNHKFSQEQLTGNTEEYQETETIDESYIEAEIEPEEEVVEDDFVKKLELYKDLINEDKSVINKSPDNGNSIKRDISIEKKNIILPDNLTNSLRRQPFVHNEVENVSKSINDQLDKVEKSLSYLQNNKKSKQQMLDNTIFIYGGTKDIEEKWKMELEKCLQEYGLTHQWLLSSEKDILKGPGKGIILLLSINSLQLIENSELILRNTKIPSVKHQLTNLTKLKLDIIDSFVRKK